MTKTPIGDEQCASQDADPQQMLHANPPTPKRGLFSWLSQLFMTTTMTMTNGQARDQQEDGTPLATPPRTPLSAQQQGSSSSSLSDSTLWVDDVYVGGAAGDKMALATTSWAFYDWLRRLPRLALLHLLSSVQQPESMHSLLAYQFDQEQQQQQQQHANHHDHHHHHHTSRLYQATDDHMTDATTTPMEEAIRELAWIQMHARATIHQHDRLRPNEQFARVDQIADALMALIRLCAAHPTTSWQSLLAHILIASECLDAPSQVRQHLFYRAKIGRLLILEMTTVLKNYHDGDENDANNDENATTTTHDAIQPLTPHQLLLARHFFYSSSPSYHFPPASATSCSCCSSSAASADDNMDDIHAWYLCLQHVCGTMASMDPHWLHHQEYHQVITYASALFIPAYHQHSFAVLNPSIAK
ncbi:hypothetical protein BC940DRAFT_318346 [Gongronella butleri]|nr:hypothetical protein BC940DRAFT_318346 [Gongronella butleri]